MIIKHDNIIYMPTISALGGIETYVYELVKKYSYLDIAVVSKSCDPIQAKRIRKYCRLYIHNGEKIDCKVAIINYDQTIHADYTNPIYTHRPHPHKRVESFICITKFLKDKMKDILYPNKILLSYNPLTIDSIKPIILVSATRLHKHKGLERMKILAKKLDEANVNYLWFVISNDTDGDMTFPPSLSQPRLSMPLWL